MAAWLFSLTVAVLAVLGGMIHLAPTTVFDPVELQAIAKTAIAAHPGNATAVVNAVIDNVRAKYPKHTMGGDEWMFNNAGGAMGSMIVLHASFSECARSRPAWAFSTFFIFCRTPAIIILNWNTVITTYL